jgi:hypothetical protein
MGDVPKPVLEHFKRNYLTGRGHDITDSMKTNNYLQNMGLVAGLSFAPRQWKAIINSIQDPMHTTIEDGNTWLNTSPKFIEEQYKEIDRVPASREGIGGGVKNLYDRMVVNPIAKVLASVWDPGYAQQQEEARDVYWKGKQHQYD